MPQKLVFAKQNMVDAPPWQKRQQPRQSDRPPVDRGHGRAMRSDPTGPGLPQTAAKTPQGKYRKAVDRAERADDAETGDKKRAERGNGDIRHPKIAGQAVPEVAITPVERQRADHQSRKRRDHVDLHGCRGVQENVKKHMGLASVLGYVPNRSVAATALAANPAFAGGRAGFVNDSNLKLALRETTGLLRQPGVWVGMVAVALILALSGPFGTINMMRIAPRFAYWGLIVLVTFFSGAFVSDWTLAGGRARRLGFAGAIVLAGGATGLVVTAEVLMLNWAAFGLAPANGGYVAEIALNCTAIALIVSAVLAWQQRQTQTNSGTTRLLDRIEIDKRGALLSLSQQDHYVQITTSAGASLILMRLADAIAETEGTPGLQVHRSHWVATNAVAAARRVDGKVVLTLHDGQDLPVSRTYVAAVRRAGLLPDRKRRDG